MRGVYFALSIRTESLVVKADHPSSISLSPLIESYRNFLSDTHASSSRGTTIQFASIGVDCVHRSHLLTRQNLVPVQYEFHVHDLRPQHSTGSLIGISDASRAWCSTSIPFELQSSLSTVYSNSSRRLFSFSRMICSSRAPIKYS